MKIADCMKRDVVSITASASIGQAAARFASRHIGMLPVVHAVGHLVGVLQLRDLLALVMPDFVQLVDDFDFVHDFGAVESQQPSPEMLARPVTEVMQPPISFRSSRPLAACCARLPCCASTTCTTCQWSTPPAGWWALPHAWISARRF